MSKQLNRYVACRPPPVRIQLPPCFSVKAPCPRAECRLTTTAPPCDCLAATYQRCFRTPAHAQTSRWAACCSILVRPWIRSYRQTFRHTYTNAARSREARRAAAFEHTQWLQGHELTMCLLAVVAERTRTACALHGYLHSHSYISNRINFRGRMSS